VQCSAARTVCSLSVVAALTQTISAFSPVLARGANTSRLGLYLALILIGLCSRCCRDSSASSWWSHEGLVCVKKVLSGANGLPAPTASLFALS
jgi:hypothetical protein